MLRNTLSKWSGISQSKSLLLQPFQASYRPAVRPSLLNISGHQLEDRVVMSFGVSGLLSPIAATSQPIAEVAAGTRLASIDTTQSVLLNGLLTDLAGGTSLNLTVLDYNGLAGGDLNLGHLLTNIQNQLSLPIPEAALTTNLTLGQILASAQAVAQADGNPALATILGTAQSQLNTVTGTTQLGQLLDINLPTQSLSQAEVNALDLLVGGVQLYNLGNVLGTSGSVNLTGPELGGLTSVASSVTLQAQIIDAPVITIGGTGSQFASAQIRLKLNVDLIDASIDTTALLGSIQSLVGPLATVNASAFVGGLDLYIDVARGSGTIQAINAITDAVTLQATPSIADVYLGTIADSLFFNRGRALNPATDLTPTTIGGVTVNVAPLGLPVVAINFGLTARAISQAAPASASVLTFTPSYPEFQTIGSGAVAVGNAVTSLLSNLQIGTTGALGILSPIVGTLTSNILPVASAALQPALTAVLGNVADPALNTLGIRIGELDLAVLGADSPDRAVANNDAALTLANRPVNVRVLANDFIPAGSTQTLTILSGPAHGSVVVNADNSVTFTPTAGYTGSDAFGYSLTDSLGRVSSAAVSVFVGFAPLANAAPTLSPDIASTPGTAINVAVLTNDSDPDGDLLTLVGVSQPAHGTAVANADGTVTYTPVNSFIGTDTFAYAAGDGKGGIALAQVTINVGGGFTPNRAPTARPDVATLVQGGTVTSNVLANDTDPDNDTLQVVSLSQPANGSVVLNNDGTVTYTPNAGYFGLDRYTYTAADPSGAIAGATVTITVQRANQNPVANPDTISTTALLPASVNVLANDTDANGDTLSILSITQPSNGLAVLGAGGSISYTPAIGFTGSDSFTYIVTDGFGGTATGTVMVSVSRGNVAPVAIPDVLITTSGASASVNVLANDIDLDGDTLTVTAVSQGAHGTVTIGAGGFVTYTPTAGYIGLDSFSYTVSDGFGGTTVGLVAVTVLRGNVVPVATPDVLITTAGASASVNVLTNDIDLDGDTLTVTAVSQGAHGTVTIGIGGLVSYTPTAGYLGVDSFTYTVNDGQGGTAVGLVAVTVLPGNTSPVATPDVLVTTSGVAGSVNVLANDLDLDGDTLTVTGLTQPTHGTVALGVGGLVTYTSTAGFIGVDSFSYTVSDGQGGTATGVVAVTVLLGNTPPVATPDVLVATSGIAANVNVLVNDLDLDGNTLSIQSVTQGAHGTVTIGAGGFVTYTPTAGYIGVDAFSYTVSDGNGGTAVGLVAVTVLRGNIAPVATPDVLIATAGVAASVNVVANDIDLDGDTLVVTGVSQGAHGTVTIGAGGFVTYTPTAGYVGLDSFTYTASDGNGGTAVGLVAVTVLRGNGAPVANPDNLSAISGLPTSVNVLGNDTDPDGDILLVSNITQPAHGIAVIGLGGTIIYTPTLGYVGNDSFTYTAADAFGGTAIGTVTVSVARNNIAPVAVADVLNATIGASASVNVLANDIDLDGDTLTVTAVTQPAHGTVTIGAGGFVTYTPATGFIGVDSFSYTADDGFGGTATGIVAVTVLRGNIAPVATPDVLATTTGVAATVNVLTNDIDLDGDTLTVASVTQGAHGSVTIGAGGLVNYTPTAGFIGVDSFTYTSTDGNGGTGTGVVVVTVFRGNGAPIAVPDVFSTQLGVSANVNLLVNDTDPDGDTLTIFSLTQPANGTVTLGVGGSLTYTPAVGFVGVDSFIYVADDGYGGRATGFVTVNVLLGNRSPIAVSDTLTTVAGVAAGLNVLANDSDPDGNTLNVQSLIQPGHGTVTLGVGGVVTYTPAAGFVGVDTFSYISSDGQGGTATGVVTVTVVRGNGAPTVQPDVISTIAGAVGAVNVLANDTDPDGDALFVTQLTQPANGVAMIGAGGVVMYVPNLGFIGTDSFQYTAIDGLGGTGTGTITVTVLRGNGSPIALPDFLSTIKGIAVSTNLLSNDNDPDNDALSIASITQPTHGTVTIGAGGVVIYTPNAGYVGTDSFSYTSTDGQGGMANGLVSVTVLRGNANPVSTPDGFTTTVNVPITTNVLVNDTDPDGDPLSILNIMQPAHGTVTIGAGGAVTYTPNAGFLGTDSFAYTISDGLGGISTGVATVTVNPAVVPPVTPPVVPPVTPPTAPPVTPPVTPPVVPPNVPPTLPPATTPVLKIPVFQRVFSVVGANTTGGPRLTVFGSDGSQQFNFFAYDSSIRVGASGAIGDVNGDGITDLVTAPGLGGGPHIRILNGIDLSPISDFFAFESSIRTGASVNVGDVNGDGFGDVIVGAGEGGGPRVSVFSGRDGSLLKNFFAFDSSIRSGVRVGHADFNGDGNADIIVTTGAGPQTRVRIFDGVTTEVLQDIAPLGVDYTAGAHVSGGDYDNDGVPDLVVGAGSAESRVQIFSGLTTNVLANYMAYESEARVGVSVVARHMSDDGPASILTGPGLGGGPRVICTETSSQNCLFDYFAFEDSFRGGITVG